MKRWMVPILASVVFSAPSFALFGLFESDDEKKDMSSLESSVTEQLSKAQSTPLADQLTSKLDVTPAQAAGGAGALLSLAQTQLPDEQTKELNSLIPGLTSFTGSTGLTDKIANMDSVKSTFESLGLDPSLISQFAPVILDYLGSQGASSGLLDSLGGLWK